MKKNILITKHLLDNIFLGLPQSIKSTLDEKDIELILTIRNKYNTKASQNMVNETAFMSLEEYVEQAFPQVVSKTVSMDQINAVFNALELYFFDFQ